MTGVSAAAVYIGRIGGLAATLGIGAAVFCGTASAAPAESASDGASSPASGQSSPHTAKPDEKPDSAKDTASGEDSATPRAGVLRAAVDDDTDAPSARKRSVKSARAAAVADSPSDATDPGPAPTDPIVITPAALTEVADPVTAPRPARTVRTATDGPAVPVDPPLSWTMLAAASRNTLAPTAATTRVVDPVTNAPVIATPKTPLLEPLQQVPVFGPLFVTPIVAVINQIPVVSDLLHPIVGYPLEAGRPAGTPRPRDVMLTSFDGTRIYAHFMPAVGLRPGEQAATILQGPGLLLPGATNLKPTPLDGIIADTSGLVYIGTLRAAGYNVVTWDPRGEHSSGGRLEQGSPDFEAKDVSAIISWVATQPEARLDPGVLDPRIGMTGASYGGGIQLVAAGTDPRIDAIVPAIAWNSFSTAYYKNQSYKSSWTAILTAGTTLFTRANPAILPATIFGVLTGRQTQAQQDRLAQLGPGAPRDLVGKITAPTLLIQGTVDTLFSLQEADTTAQTLIANRVPTKVIWFCGGHGLCANNVFDPTDGVVIQQATLAWLDRYVNGNTEAVTGPRFEFVDQRGQFYASDTYRIVNGSPVTAGSSGGLLPLVPFIGGSGPMFGVLPIGGSKAFNALNLTTPALTTTTVVAGAPRLTLSYSGTGIARHVYAQLVDDSTGLVLGGQVTPIPVTLDGQPRSISIALEPVAHTLKPGQTVTVQLVASSTLYATITSFGSMRVTDMHLSVPTADPARITPRATVS
ncbi:S15 peptidase family protein [Mycobacterium sp. Root265]|uniref:S15 peptidase family protein n=1 Tax=Mycobacterium sp. Root265 TaxID=1736504 RepID=UPI000A92D69F|nr:CocE/NonD family hydrolase [Mycobacterium sp. Root265]